MAENFLDQLSRVRLMAEGDSGTWDLSDNDLAALTAVLDSRDLLRVACAAVLAHSAKHPINSPMPLELVYQMRKAVGDAD